MYKIKTYPKWAVEGPPSIRKNPPTKKKQQYPSNEIIVTKGVCIALSLIYVAALKLIK